VDFVVHIFSETARKFYDLERLWKTATRVELSDLEKPARKAAPAKTAVARKSVAKPAKRSTARKSAAKKSSTPRKRS
jgi:ribosome-associated protein